MRRDDKIKIMSPVYSASVYTDSRQVQNETSKNENNSFDSKLQSMLASSRQEDHDCLLDPSSSLYSLLNLFWCQLLCLVLLQGRKRQRAV